MKRAGGTQRRWRAVVGPIKLYGSSTHVHCNWSIAPSGTSREVAEVERLLDEVRLARPIVAQG
ncbi:hypothetical protein M9978_07885 [Sphingomonas sp. MG17]|uniref:Uncharacterized protein n=1 Tax=Sphingomonas tagetis TaxID=2949092 RepID=A0A9X2KL73_9SPHN|nr:hypothetical protein [Sphingomonas tagetis]MCP3730347.1 hypothetical protein [Sphingomonas tagetis]